jgi:hypothetical protein
MSPELIALTMFAGMMVMLLSGQRVFAAIGFIGTVARRRCARVAGRLRPASPTTARAGHLCAARA